MKKWRRIYNKERNSLKCSPAANQIRNKNSLFGWKNNDFTILKTEKSLIYTNEQLGIITPPPREIWKVNKLHSKFSGSEQS